MVLCPKCGSPRLVQKVEFSHPDGIVREQVWSCPDGDHGCGWSGRFPNRVKGSLLIASMMKALRVRRFTKSMRDLQASGDVILLESDGTKEILY